MPTRMSGSSASTDATTLSTGLTTPDTSTDGSAHMYGDANGNSVHGGGIHTTQVLSCEMSQRVGARVGIGNSGIIEFMPCRTKVKKSPHPFAQPHVKSSQIKELEREFEIYRRLPSPHPRLLRMFGYTGDEGEESLKNRGIILEYMSKGNLRDMLQSDAEIPVEQRKRWCIEAAEATALLHTHNIIHCDIKPSNMLLDDNLGIRIIDMGGSMIDGKEPMVLGSSRNFLPRNLDEVLCNAITDLFGLGSTLYEIMTRKEPYADVNDEEVEALFSRKEFPHVDSICFGETIRRLWHCEIESASAALEALVTEEAQERMLGS